VTAATAETGKLKAKVNTHSLAYLSPSLSPSLSLSLSLSSIAPPPPLACTKWLTLLCVLASYLLPLLSPHTNHIYISFLMEGEEGLPPQPMDDIVTLGEELFAEGGGGEGRGHNEAAQSGGGDDDVGEVRERDDEGGGGAVCGDSGSSSNAVGGDKAPEKGQGSRKTKKRKVYAAPEGCSDKVDVDQATGEMKCKHCKRVWARAGVGAHQIRAHYQQEECRQTAAKARAAEAQPSLTLFFKPSAPISTGAPRSSAIM